MSSARNKLVGSAAKQYCHLAVDCSGVVRVDLVVGCDGYRGDLSCDL